MGSMYGIFTYIYHTFMPHVGEYTIHGSYGYGSMILFDGKRANILFRLVFGTNTNNYIHIFIMDKADKEFEMFTFSKHTR